MLWLVVLCVSVITLSSGQGVRPRPVDDDGLVDLSHSYADGMLVFPTIPKFNLTTAQNGLIHTNPEVFVYGRELSLSEHTGTHMDAPAHFTRDGTTVDEIVLSRFRAPACVINIATQAAENEDYQLTVSDIQSWESRHGELPAGAALLVRTDWSKYYIDRAKYFGSSGSDPSQFHYPSLSPDAARWLVANRHLSVYGVDTISLDGPPSLSQNYGTHRALLNNGIIGLENLNNLEKLPETGATLYAFPLKIRRGSGGPTRVFADLTNSAPSIVFNTGLQLLTLMGLLLANKYSGL